jgi:hypothetical protein
MFSEIISNIPTPKYLSLDNDPLSRFASFRGATNRNYTSRIY